MTTVQRRALLTDPASYPGQRLADPRPEQSREDLIRHYQVQPIPGQQMLPLAAAVYTGEPRWSYGTAEANLNTRASVRDWGT